MVEKGRRNVFQTETKKNQYGLKCAC